MSQISLANTVIMENHDATTNPGVNDDITQGYKIGSRWCNISSVTLFTCTDNTAGAATWNSIAIGEGSSSLSTPPVLDGTNSGTENLDYTLTITNYDAANIYSIFTSAGSQSRTSNTITWTLPEVDQDTVGSITVYSTEPGLPISLATVKNTFT